MIALARSLVKEARRRVADKECRGHYRAALTLLLVPLAWPSVASAQTTARIAVQTDYRLRGFSLSSEEPVIMAEIGHELGGGFYLNGAGQIVFDDEPSLLGGQVNLGYARRINSAFSVDTGLIHAEYLSGYGGDGSGRYTEVYVGAQTGGLAARLYFSPHYFRSTNATLYGELEGAIPVAAHWRVNVHAGVLHYLEGATPLTRRNTQLDWRLDLTRRMGRLEALVSISGFDPDYDPYPHVGRGNPAVMAGLSLAF